MEKSTSGEGRLTYQSIYYRVLSNTDAGVLTRPATGPRLHIGPSPSQPASVQPLFCGVGVLWVLDHPLPKLELQEGPVVVGTVGGDPCERHGNQGLQEVLRELHVLLVLCPSVLGHDAVAGVEGPQVHVQMVGLAVLHTVEVALHRPLPHVPVGVHQRPGVQVLQVVAVGHVLQVDAQVNVIIPGDDVLVAGRPEQSAPLQPVAHARALQDIDDGAQAAGWGPALQVKVLRGVVPHRAEAARGLLAAAEPLFLAVGVEEALDAEVAHEAGGGLPQPCVRLPLVVGGAEEGPAAGREAGALQQLDLPAAQRGLDEEGGQQGARQRGGEVEQVLGSDQHHGIAAQGRADAAAAARGSLRVGGRPLPQADPQVEALHGRAGQDGRRHQPHGPPALTFQLPDQAVQLPGLVQLHAVRHQQHVLRLHVELGPVRLRGLLRAGRQHQEPRPLRQRKRWVRRGVSHSQEGKVRALPQEGARHLPHVVLKVLKVTYQHCHAWAPPVSPAHRPAPNRSHAPTHQPRTAP
ncbi:hypothetical protein JZ751_017113 [Albula glossodonta]|uniref:Uncharacterized protein n=1 Tax=Albula glossodonta TaxID=121402 RepID=A0A8T2NP32_9TELE|nr:hypothetical protein JZ751_017113 [Albula glossodonta]